ncbi:hypothetical protein LR69_02182 [Geobacillus sp. BCO2]|nr:hypothetical protein LR69_02182 [Geobacillus sp. BCO2]
MKRKWMAALAALLLVLAGCTGKSETTGGNSNKEKPAAQKEDISKFPMTVKNDGKIIDGGVAEVRACLRYSF